MNKRVARRRRRRPRPFAAQVTGGNRVEGGRSADRWRRRLRWISVSYGFLLWKVYQINVSPTAASTGNNSVRKAIAQKNKYFALCVLRFCVFSFFIMMKSSLPEGTLFPASCRGVPNVDILPNMGYRVLRRCIEILGRYQEPNRVSVHH